MLDGVLAGPVGRCGRGGSPFSDESDILPAIPHPSPLGTRIHDAGVRPFIGVCGSKLVSGEVWVELP